MRSNKLWLRGQFCIIFFFFSSFVNGQNQWDVREDGNGVEIYMNNNMWYYLRESMFDYKEGGPLCGALSLSLVDYEEISVDDTQLVKLSCSDNVNMLSECTGNIESGKDDKLGINCRASNGVSGSVDQLDDKRILYLYKPAKIEFFVWAHICFKENNGWNTKAANLFCQELGYQNVVDDRENVKYNDNVRAFGLKGFACDSQATSFSECTFSAKGGSGRCEDNEVITIECENPIITTPTTQTTTQTTTITTTQATTTTTPPTTQATTTTTPPTTQTTKPTTQSIIEETTKESTIDFVETTEQQQNTPVPQVHSSSQNSSQTTTTTTATGNQNASNNPPMAIIGIIVFLLVFVLLLIGGLIILIFIIIKYRKGRLNSKLKGRHNLSLLAKPIDSEQYINQYPASDYMVPKDIFDENYASIDAIFDENIYDGVVYGYDHYVPSSEERNYYSIDENEKVSNEYQYTMENHYQTSVFCESEYWEPGTTIEGIYSQMSHNHFREICKSELVQDKIMGEGNFGLVMSGTWNSKAGNVPVAMKSLKDESEGSDVNFLQEAAILGQFNHANVLKLLGMVTLTKPLTMVTELMRTGLKEFLNNTRVSGEAKFDVFGALFLKFSNDIANGMQHLSSKKFIHRDLSARNVLVSNGLRCKISDFGLARHAIEEDEYYTSSGGLIPLKWTAPEAIFYKKYSEKSDVWSYGITLHEIWSVGAVPWKGVKAEQIIQNVSDGINLAPPSGCPMKVYELMVDCWNPSKDMRPTFNEIVTNLKDNEDVFLKRGNNMLEQMDFGQPSITVKNLFKDLQTKYASV